MSQLNIISFFSYSLCLIILFVCVTNSLDEGTPCNLSTGQFGLCQNVQTCPFVINILKTNKSHEAIQFLQSLICGYSGNIALVCCPTDTFKSAPNIDTNEELEKTANVGDLPEVPDCGLSTSNLPKVVGGVPATLGEFPWVVALGYKNTKTPSQPKWLCGGSLITKNHVLTAGHCITDTLYLARVGELNLYRDDDGAHPVDIPIAKTILHEGYPKNQRLFDIAILVLSRSTDGIDKVWPICLPWKSDLRSRSFENYNPFVAGWGKLYANGPSSDVLLKAQVPVVQNSICQSQYRTLSVINDSVLCAGKGNQDACNGDSGGPLMYGQAIMRQIRFYLIGVVSYGSGCANRDFAGVYARVTYFIDWIREHIATN
ncbi:venom protease [Rhynchophorus ferrugineus]|uniref:CLIP domain-containing serine protease n=1 Tax=Rhynchophorus ferrugineus TaxID=354439 RepID=A0A834M5A1_RHYFE|nr:hypothetical protein GWI33_018360 [Rhynchophorus ferrugineus]